MAKVVEEWSIPENLFIFNNVSFRSKNKLKKFCFWYFFFLLKINKIIIKFSLFLLLNKHNEIVFVCAFLSDEIGRMKIKKVTIIYCLSFSLPAPIRPRVILKKTQSNGLVRFYKYCF